MKKYITILVLIVFTNLSCESDFLEPKPDSLITPENLNDPELLLRGAFEHLRSSNDSWKVSTFLMVNYGSDEVIANALRTTSGNFWDLTTFAYNSRNDEFRKVYTFLFGGVNAANHAIVVAKRTGNKEIEAEARFIRGYYYFVLSTFFGGMPILETPDDNPYTQRSSMEETLLFIEKDWLFASENSPQVAFMAGRTTRLTAAAYLAKLYLYIGGCMQNNIDSAIASVSDSDERKRLVSFSNWGDTRTPNQYFQLAENYANAVYNNYSLIDNYRDNFRKSGEDVARSNEWIFNIEASDIIVDGLPEAFNIASGFHMQNNRQLIPNYEFVDMYIGEDTRKGNVVKSPGANSPTEIINGYVHYLDIESNRNGGPIDYIWGKWRRDLSTGLHQRWLTSGLALMRYADVLLLFAEAKFLNGNESGARALLSEVRLRATSTDSNKNNTVLDAMNTSYFKTDFMEELLDERKRELCVEGHRRIDLMRTGQIFNKINSLTSKNSSGSDWRQGGITVSAMQSTLSQNPYRIWFPLPAEQVTVGGYLQNPGYPQ